MYSQRFNKEVILTQHAQLRMEERGIDGPLLLDLVDTGEIRYKDETHIWIAKYYSQRNDNLLCIAAALEAGLIVKTVMHRFTWESEP